MVGLDNTERAGGYSGVAARLVRACSDVRRRVGSVHHLLPRCLWAVMAAAHMPALLSVWESFITSGFDVARLGGCLGLSLSMLFFGLKIYGVTFLRVRSRPRSWIAMSLVVVLVHLDVLSAHPHASVVPQCLTIVTSLVCIAVAVRLGRALTRALRRVNTLLNCRFRTTRSTETVWLDAFRPHCWVRAGHLYALRAPPA